MIYEWRSKDIHYSVPASTVGKIFEKIEKKNGSVTNKSVLDSARPESSPIHKVFEWDDDVAAEKYRLSQAGQLIRNLVIATESAESSEPIMVRAFVDVSEKREGSYIGVVHAFSEEETRERVLSDAIRELNSFRKKYSNYQEFSKIFSEIDKLKIA